MEELAQTRSWRRPISQSFLQPGNYRIGCVIPPHTAPVCYEVPHFTPKCLFHKLHAVHGLPSFGCFLDYAYGTEGGKSVAEVVQHLGVSEQTYYRWKNQYGGMKSEEAKRLKELEIENARLKKLLAEAELDKAMLKEIASGNW